MGTRGTHASDGTPRCSEPQQDAAGRWFCPACGRAEGFKSKMAVLGHLRSCRPGKPAIRELLEPMKPQSSVYLPTPNEAAQINGMGAILSRLDQMSAVQAQHSKALGNHITHLSAQTASAAPSPVSSLSLKEMVKWGGLAVLGISLMDRLTPKPSPVLSWPVGFTPSESTQRMSKKMTAATAAKCAALWKARAEGQDVEMDDECLGDADAPVRPASRKKKSVQSIAELAGAAKEALSLTKSIQGLLG